ncbi:MAG TPA: A/G-specific adenine glycosylase [Saprospiraceae bacterium]|nr:A/G-specific adenine glycosylase [Saprospiraceae bacterium]
MDISFRRVAQFIVAWSEEHPRIMPWKKTTDPYKIWLSEIILQQTQVSQGLPFYLAFIRRFPTVRRLAKASEDEVLRLWQGLGYNSRARNMHAAARTIVNEFQAVFPNSYEQIRRLKGVGDYTAAAIASFAFGLPTPVLDSNVIRVLSRVKGIAGDPAKRRTRAEFYDVLGKMIRGNDPAQFNQAIMNFGAMQCTPRNPDCDTCVLSKHCVAYRDGLVEELPMRKMRAQKRKRFFHYFLIIDKKGLVIHQRTTKDIWQQMYDFPMLDVKTPRAPSHVIREDFIQKFGVKPPFGVKRLQSLSQSLTHQEICCAFYVVRVRRIERRELPADYRYESFENLRTFAFPKVIRTFLSDNSLLLVKLPQGS